MIARSAPVRRVLVVGSWAKEQITIEHLKATSEVEVHAFIEVANPGIMQLADGHELGNASEVGQVVDAAERSECDLVLVTTAAPLQAGLVDALDEAGIPTFAPTREAARLEWDKAFARDLVSEVCPDALPRFRTCEGPEKARAFAEELEWDVAVKPLGLTEGLGVRVAGDQLDGPREVGEYIDEVCAESIGGTDRVLIEQRLTGEEFIIQALVAEDRMVATPAVRDFKKLLPEDRGPNTASMGSWAAGEDRLPFLRASHHRRALEIMQRSLQATAARTDGCRGFLYGQFMITASGIKLIEYNFRPGDPEWLNTVSCLSDPLLDAITALLEGRPARLRSRPEASVVQYIVPPEYPERLHQILDVDLDPDAVRELGVHAYYSSGRDEEGRLDVGSERGIAFLATADTIPRAHEKVESAIATVDGRFHHRSDIGTARQIRAAAHAVDDLERGHESFRCARQEDAEAVRDLIDRTPPLEPYPHHQYVIVLRYLGDSSFVAVVDDEIAAFEVGFPSSSRPKTYFLWQIGVAPDYQGRGLGTRLLAHVEERVAAAGCRRIEATVDPDNEASLRLFEAAGYDNIGRREGETLLVEGRPAVRDHYGPDCHFVLFEKRLEETSPP